MFILAAGLLLISGTTVWAAARLALYADGIAERFRLSRSWIGLLFVSIVTTLPEGSVTIGAVVKVGRPDLALSNNFGSILFNLTIIAIVDAVFRRGGILRFTQEKNALPVACAMTMLVLVLGMLLFPVPVSLGPVHFGGGAILAIAVFLGLFVFMERFEAREIIPGTPQTPETAVRARHPAAGFLICGGIVVAGGIALAILGDRLADAMALRHSFVGFMLLAVITSLPELTFGISAARIGAYDLLLGNVLGASMINALVIALADLAHWRAVLGIPGAVGYDQALAGLLALLSMSLILIGIINRRGARRRRVIGTTSRLLLLIYGVCALAMYFGVNQ